MTDRVDALLAPYRSPAAARLYDEHVTELAHALQCADQAIEDGAPDALVVAALFHDIGHLLASGAAVTGEPDDGHELTGARHLRRHFGPEVAAPVASHVMAKRFLVATDAGYRARLSPASRHSLERQGGPLPRHCLADAEARPHWDDAVRLRRWDDAAKEPGRPTRALDDHVDRIRSLLR